MPEISKQTKLTFQQVIELARSGANLDEVCVFVADADDVITADLECFVDDCPTIDPNDVEVYPEFVRQKKLELIYYGQQFADVVHNVESQKADAALATYVDALNFYLNNDDFLDVQ